MKKHESRAAQSAAPRFNDRLEELSARRVVFEYHVVDTARDIELAVRSECHLADVFQWTHLRFDECALEFARDGKFYVTSCINNMVLKYDPTSGEMAFGPD